MGATGWTYFTPYHPDPAAALQQLRERVFAAGEYQQPPSRAQQLQQLRVAMQFMPSEAHINRHRAELNWETAAKARTNPEQFLNPIVQQAYQGIFASQQFAPPDAPFPEQVIAFHEREAARYDALAEQSGSGRPQLERFLTALETGSVDGLPPDEVRSLRMYQEINAASPWMRPDRDAAQPPQTIEELLDLAAENGTHSILDVTRIAKRRAIGAAAPLAKKVLRAEFGSEQPTRAQVEAGELRFAEDLYGCAVYFAVYESEEPTEWVFIGSSGD